MTTNRRTIPADPLTLFVLFFYPSTLQVSSVSSQSQYQLSVVTQIAKCFGGAACLIQPTFKLTSTVTGTVATTFTGTAFVIMGSSPSGREPLYQGSCGLSGVCGAVVKGVNTYVQVIDGFMTFTGLTIKTAGVGYTLKVTAQSNGGGVVASVITPTFSVAVGPSFQLIFSSYVSSSTGGVPLNPPPSVGVVDQGGNIVTSVGVEVTCKASLSISPSGREQLQPPNFLTTSFINGLATFPGLYINQQGYPYQIAFNATSTTGVSELFLILFVISYTGFCCCFPHHLPKSCPTTYLSC